MTKNNHTTAICAGARHRLCCCAPWNCFQPRTPDALLARSSLKYKSEKGDKYKEIQCTLLLSDIKLIRFDPPFVILALYRSRQQRWMVEEQRRSVVFPLRLLGIKWIPCCDQSTRCSNANTMYQSHHAMWLSFPRGLVSLLHNVCFPRWKQNTTFLLWKMIYTWSLIYFCDNQSQHSADWTESSAPSTKHCK